MKKGEKRRLELLKIAYKMFLTRGYESTSEEATIEEALFHPNNVFRGRFPVLFYAIITFVKPFDR